MSHFYRLATEIRDSGKLGKHFGTVCCYADLAVI